MKEKENILFRNAKVTDLDHIVTIYQAAIDEMNKNNIFQWDEIYPNREVLEDDIIKQQLYIGILKDTICSAFVLNQEEDEEYVNGAWEYKMSSFYVIHRLCVNPIFQNQGIGTKTMRYIEKILREQAVETIRLDSFSLNPYAVKMYRSLGYNIVGEVHWRKGMFYLMEKNILHNNAIKNSWK